MFRKAVFSMDCFDGTLDGFTYGEKWNGWSCPYFNYENAVKLMGLVNPEAGMQYDEKTDKFFIGSDEDQEEWESVTIEGQKYYPIGNCSWCWLELEEQS